MKIINANSAAFGLSILVNSFIYLILTFISEKNPFTGSFWSAYSNIFSFPNPTILLCWLGFLIIFLYLMVVKKMDFEIKIK